MGDLGLGPDRIGGTNDDAEGEEGEIEDGDVERRRGENEGHVAFEQREGLEGESEGVDLAEEGLVRDVAVGGGVDEGGRGGLGHGGTEEGEGELGEGEGLRERREWDRRPERVEGLGTWAVAALRVDPTSEICC